MDWSKMQVLFLRFSIFSIEFILRMIVKLILWNMSYSHFKNVSAQYPFPVYAYFLSSFFIIF